MKTLLSLGGGALQVTEQGGVFTIAFDDSVLIGGGSAAGLLSFKGKGEIVLSGAKALLLGETLLNAKLSPALLPEAEFVEGVVNAAVAEE